jgi:predicted AlkP superfamily pyrophosphatase or phosphodiesterase
MSASKTIGQDFGDVFALMAPGYNFDGIQNPGVARLGDAPFNAATTTVSMPNFYGAHGHDPELSVMSATFIAAGPQIRETTIRHMRNVDVAPTIMKILGVKPQRVDGEVLDEILR